MYNRTIQEAKVHKLSERLYGNNPIVRLMKLQEEIQELDDSIQHDLSDQSIKDELSDCLFVLLSLMGIYNTTIGECTDLAIHKITERETNPNFKR